MKPTNESPYIDIEVNTKLMRYMDSDFFLAQLNMKSLFFKKASFFDDKDEFSLPISEQEFKKNYYGEDVLKCAKEGYKQLKETTIVSCWTLSEEKLELWNRFCNPNGIAVLTTRCNLIEAFANSYYNIDKSKVRYLDYETDMFYDREEYPIELNFVTSPVITKQKNKGFEVEAEYRLFIDLGLTESLCLWTKEQKNESGRFIKANIKLLVDYIIFHPEMSDKRKNELKHIFEAFGFNFKFIESKFNKTK